MTPYYQDDAVTILAAYDGLVARCLAQHPQHAAYIEDLSRSWRGELEPVAIQPETDIDHAARWLIRQISDCRPDTSLEWLDAFPDHIVWMARGYPS